MPRADVPPSPTTPQRSTGDRYEALALARAEAEGLKLLARNFSCRHGEIDLILRDGDTIVFLEVRYRRTSGFGGAIGSVGAAKRERLAKAASLYLQSQPRLARQPCRFDVMAISGDSETAQIDWLRNAFETE